VLHLILYGAKRKIVISLLTIAVTLGRRPNVGIELVLANAVSQGGNATIKKD
jgi:hypothetical protein